MSSEGYESGDYGETYRAGEMRIFSDEHPYGRPGTVEDLRASQDRGYSSGSCFSASSKVLTPLGWQRIAELQPSDEVFSLNTKTQKVCQRKIIKLLSYPESRLWEIKTSISPTPVQTTAAHSFLTLKGWVKTSALKKGMTMFCIAANQKPTICEVLAVQKTDLYEPVYNLVTETDHTFIVSGLVAHNFTYFRCLRVLFYRIMGSILAVKPNPIVHGTAFGSP